MFNRKRIAELEQRIARLERDAAIDVFEAGGPSTAGMFYWGSQWPMKQIPIKDAVRMLAKHCGVKFAHKSGERESFFVAPLDTVKINKIKPHKP